MLNVAIIMGRLTADPELRTTASGVAVTTFSVAVDRRFQRQGEEKQTDFIDCVAWRQTAEFVSKYFTKGSMAVVSGRLQIRDWTDRDGGKRRSAEVVVDNMYFGESRRRDGDSGDSRSSSYSSYGNSGSAGKSSAPAASAFSELDDGDGELPF